MNVEGTVTLDGKPVAGAVVDFRPVDETIRGAAGMTDESGHYKLSYTRDKVGTLPGKYRIVISTAQGDYSSPNERVPRKYNANTTLTADVTEDGQVVDFALSTEGTEKAQRR